MKKDQKLFTVEEIKIYLQSQDSLGDIHYYLSEENIIKANNEFNEADEESEELIR